MLIDRLNLELIQFELDVHLTAQINLVYYLSFHLAPAFNFLSRMLRIMPFEDSVNMFLLVH
jgi:hypothetical protein